MAMVCALALPAGATAHEAHNPSLPAGPGPDPGPELLYKKAPKPAPQLRNHGPWKANPLLISGASGYANGEFLYQDYLYDDHGAKATARDPSDPRTADDTFSAPNGTYTYPTNPALPQQHRRPGRVPGQGEAPRDRLPPHPQLDDRAGAGRDHDRDRRLGRAASSFPHGANASAPAELVPHRPRARGRADRRRRRAGRARADAPRSRSAAARSTVTVPHAAWDPRLEDGPHGRRHRPVGQAAGDLPAAGQRGDRDRARRRRRPGGPDRALQRRVPLRRAAAGHRRPRLARRHRVVAR